MDGPLGSNTRSEMAGDVGVDSVVYVDVVIVHFLTHNEILAHNMRYVMVVFVLNYGSKQED